MTAGELADVRRAQLDRLTGLLATGAPAWGRWVSELSEHPDPPATDRLAESRAVARRVAALAKGGRR